MSGSNHAVQDPDELCRRILDHAKQLGMTQAECCLYQATGRELEVRSQQMESCESQQDQSITVTVFQDKKRSTIHMNDLSWALIKQGVDSVCDTVRFMEPDDCQGLADPDRLASLMPDVNAFHPTEYDVDQVIADACRLESLALEVDPSTLQSDGVGVGHHRYVQYYANSHGFQGAQSGTVYRMDCTLRACQSDQMQRDHDYTVARCIDDLLPVEALAKMVANRTLTRLGAKPIASQHCPALLRPEVSRQLLSYLLSALSGSRLYKESSFLCGAMGQAVLPEWMSLGEEPHQPKGMGSSPFDSEGVATQKQCFIENGVVKQYVLGSYSARRLGLSTTGNAGGVHNAVVTSGEHSHQELISMMDKGLVVTELMGNGVDLTSGRLSLGAFGYWVESGKIVHPVEGVTIAADLRELFQSIQAMGNDVDVRGNIQAGSMLLPSITVAGC